MNGWLVKLHRQSLIPSQLIGLRFATGVERLAKWAQNRHASGLSHGRELGKPKWSAEESEKRKHGVIFNESDKE